MPTLEELKGYAERATEYKGKGARTSHARRPVSSGAFFIVWTTPQRFLAARPKRRSCGKWVSSRVAVRLSAMVQAFSG
jgi:hypothetical protein